MSSQGQGYGVAADGVGCAFWALALAMFTFPMWGPVVGFLIGLVV